MKVRYNIEVLKISDGYRILIELNKNVIEMDTTQDLVGVYRGLLRYIDRRLATKILDEIRALIDGM